MSGYFSIVACIRPGLLIILGLGAYQVENGLITIGGLVALILFVERLVFPTALLGFTLNTFQLGQVSLDRIEEILQSKPKITDDPNSGDEYTVYRPPAWLRDAIDNIDKSKPGCEHWKM